MKIVDNIIGHFDSELVIERLAAAPTMAGDDNGYVYYDTALEQFRFRQDGAWIDLTTRHIAEDLAANQPVASGAEGQWYYSTDTNILEMSVEGAWKRVLTDGDLTDLNDADTLDGLDSTQFLRSDVADTASGKITLSGGAGLPTGTRISGTNLNNFLEVQTAAGAVDMASIGDMILRIDQDNNGTGHVFDVRHDVSTVLFRLREDGQAAFTDGAAATPSITFLNDLNTGIYSGVADELLFSTGGVERLRLTNTLITYNGNTVWHAGNDGAGSGLDSDTVDGLDSTAFLRSNAADTWTGKLTWAGGEATALSLGSYTSQLIDLYSTSFGIGIQNSTAYVRTSNRFSIHSGGTHSDTENDPGVGGIVLFTVKNGGSVIEAFGNTVWHAGNDGAGSGLDADTLDGSHASAFSLTGHDHATSISGTASGWTTARTLTLSGDVTGTSSAWDGTGNATLTATVANDSHTHDTRYYTETEADANFLGIGAKAADSELLDGLDSTAFLRSDTADTAAGVITFTASPVMGTGVVLGHNTDQSYDKLRVWNSSLYTIGMRNGLSFGHLGGAGTEYAMTFTMSNSADRGWLWRDDADAVTDGAMSLTTLGELHVKADITIASTSNYVWHSGNDGAGSGLDADLLDAQDGTYYLARANHTGTQTVSTLSDHNKAAHDALAIDHGSLTGLADDDHTQYHTAGRHDAADHSTAMGTVVLNDISDVTETTITTGDLLRWSGTAWVNYADSNYATSGHNHAATYVDVAGDTMTGFLTLNADPSSALHAATKQYVDAQTGVSDHGALTGLGDDDHPQYLRSDASDTGTGTITLSNAAALSVSAIAGVIDFTSTDTSDKGLQFYDTGGSPRWGIAYGGDTLMLRNRAANGEIEFYANTATVGGAGEQLVMTVRDDAVAVASGKELTIVGNGNTHLNYQGGGNHYISGNNLYLRDTASSTKITFTLSTGAASFDGAISEQGTSLASKYLGISAKAADSNLLDGIDSANFLRSNVADTFTGKLTWGGGASAGISMGNNNAQLIDLWSTTFGIGIQSNTAYVRTASRFSVHQGGSHSTAENSPGTGGTNLFTVVKSGAGSWGIMDVAEIDGPAHIHVRPDFGSGLADAGNPAIYIEATSSTANDGIYLEMRDSGTLEFQFHEQGYMLMPNNGRIRGFSNLAWFEPRRDGTIDNVRIGANDMRFDLMNEASSIYLQKTDFENSTYHHLRMRSGGDVSMLKLLDAGTAEVQVRNGADSAYIPIRASSFPTSDIMVKRDFALFTNPWTAINNAPVWTYEFDGSYKKNQNNSRKIGLVAQDLPEQVRVPDHNGVEAIDMQAVVGILWAAVRDLNARLAKFEGKEIVDPRVEKLKDDIRRRMNGEDVRTFGERRAGESLDDDKNIRVLKARVGIDTPVHQAERKFKDGIQAHMRRIDETLEDICEEKDISREEALEFISTHDLLALKENGRLSVEEIKMIRVFKERMVDPEVSAKKRKPVTNKGTGRKTKGK